MNLLRGWIGEKITTFKMWFSLGTKTYRRFHHLIISGNNGTTQIDHLLVSQYGLFIIETKNKKGWIFGSEKQPKWTQVVYNKKYSFQNPLRQTFRQKKVLSAFLGVDESIVNPIVYFVGDCKFKTTLPDNVIRKRLGRYIKKKYRNPILSAPEVERLATLLEKHESESNLTTRDHVRSLKQRYSSDIICPKCGSNLVERTVKRGSNAGSKFLGCESFPKCRYTKDV
jgi:restriction system protein